LELFNNFLFVGYSRELENNKQQNKMETLTINATNKDEAIKQINAFRLKNKNKWYQINLTYLPFTFKMKAWNTWVQIDRKYEGEELIDNAGSSMEQSVSQFKQYLQDRIR